MKKILVSTDFSPAAMNACDYASQLVKSLGAEMTLMHAFHVPVAVSQDFPALGISVEEMQHANDASLQKEASRIEQQFGVKVKSKAIMGLALEVLLEVVADYDLLVMGMRGAGTFDRLIGSVTTAALRQSKKPVLVIPESTKYRDIERVVYACDYHSETKMRSLDPLLNLLLPFTAKIFVLNVKPHQDLKSVSDVDMRSKLDIKLANIDHQYYSPESENSIEAINSFVTQNRGDLLTLIPHAYSFFEKIFHKSFSKEMTYFTKVPLLALPEYK
jgi:nucleotide-binding universal stress UspA family protein